MKTTSPNNRGRGYFVMESPGNLLGLGIGVVFWFVVMGPVKTLPVWLVVLSLPVLVLTTQVGCRLLFGEQPFPWQQDVVEDET